eukprot:3435713-Ditylum_brightwellii.AAC.1
MNFDNSSNRHVTLTQITTFFGPNMAQIQYFRSSNVTKIRIMIFFGPGMAQILSFNSNRYHNDTGMAKIWS